MPRFGRNIVFITVLGLVFSGLAFQAIAQVNANKSQVTQIASSLSDKMLLLKNSLVQSIKSSPISDQDETQLDSSTLRLQESIDGFQSKLQQNTESSNDVTEILYIAKEVNDQIGNLSLSRTAQDDWKEVKFDVEKLASAYQIQWDWNGRATLPAPTRTSPIGSRTTNLNLTGTYRLDQSRSDNISEVVDQALRSANTANREEARQDLEAKLQSPDEIAIDQQSRNVTLVSTLSQPITLNTDGSVRNETLPDGSTIRIRSMIRGQELTVSSIGNESDYTVTFAMLDNQTLKVSRRVTTDYLKQTVFAESFYSKTEQYARTDIYGNSGNSNTTAQNQPQTQPQPRNVPQPNISYGRTGQYVVPNGTIITGTLNNDISSKVSQNNDRFRMTVQAPIQFRGAIIEGYISGIRNRSGKITGRSQITFNFESIRLTNGETYDFAGFLQSVTDLNGETIKVDTEGNAKGGSQTKESIKRGGIGAGIGAVIGGLIGGGKGAIIGATIGGGAGAGSVILQKEGELDLKAGSSLSVQSSSPKTN